MSNQPTHNIVLIRKDPEGKPGKKNTNPGVPVGVAWQNNNDSYMIRLNDGVVLDWRMMETHTLHLFTRSYSNGKTEEKEHGATTQDR